MSAATTMRIKEKIFLPYMVILSFKHQKAAFGIIPHFWALGTITILSPKTIAASKIPLLSHRRRIRREFAGGKFQRGITQSIIEQGVQVILLSAGVRTFNLQQVGDGCESGFITILNDAQTLFRLRLRLEKNFHALLRRGQIQIGLAHLKLDGSGHLFQLSLRLVLAIVRGSEAREIPS